MSRSLALSRRNFLGLTGGAGLAAAFSLAGCGDDSAADSGTIRAVVPGAVPPGWDAVLAKVNEKLKAEQSLTLEVQFVNWSNYQQQALLKFTSGEKFDTALQALWLNMAQLQQDGALADLSAEIDKYKNLRGTLDDRLIKANQWDGKLWGIPQVNSAARCQHFAVRQDLADKYGFAQIADFDTLERFFYAVKQKGNGTIPYGLNSASGYLHAMPMPAGMFNVQSWGDPHTIARAFTGRGMFFIFAKDAAQTKASRPVPFWEDAGIIDALRRIRRYYQDGIINKDAVNTDTDTIKSQWQAGKYAATWAMTDGTTSNVMPALGKAVPGATVADILPYRDGFNAKPNQTFQADNLVVVNANGGDVAKTLKLQDWLSVKANHDLIEYGIEGTDWKPVGDDKFEALSQYTTFPGYALSWRASLERKAAYMTESEEKVFAWAQNYDNFTVDPLAAFVPDTKPVEQQIAAMSTVITQFANPMYYGVVDVDAQLGKLKKAAAAAGVDKLNAEMEKQANAYLAKNA